MPNSSQSGNAWEMNTAVVLAADIPHSMRQTLPQQNKHIFYHLCITIAPKCKYVSYLDTLLQKFSI